MIFLRDSLCLSAVSLSRQRHDILYFSYCPVTRVLHMTLANWQEFGLEFHLRSSPSAYYGFVNISRPAEYFTACYTVLKRPNKVETAVHGCNLAFSLDSIVSLPRRSTAYHHCLLVSLFLADQIFYRSFADRQYFLLRSFASLCSNGQRYLRARSQRFPPFYVIKMQRMDGNEELIRSIIRSEVRKAISEYFALRLYRVSVSAVIFKSYLAANEVAFLCSLLKLKKLVCFFIVAPLRAPQQLGSNQDQC